LRYVAGQLLLKKYKKKYYPRALGLSTKLDSRYLNLITTLNPKVLDLSTKRDSRVLGLTGTPQEQ
jgi:hypothetical protein